MFGSIISPTEFLFLNRSTEDVKKDILEILVETDADKFFQKLVKLFSPQFCITEISTIIWIHGLILQIERNLELPFKQDIKICTFSAIQFYINEVLTKVL